MSTQQPEAVESSTPANADVSAILEGFTFPSLESNPEQKPELAVEVPVTPTDPVTIDPIEPTKVTPPSRHTDESDIQYNLRTKLFYQGQAKADAETEEEKSILKDEMRKTRKDLGKASILANETSQTQPTPPSPTETPNIDEREVAIQTLKELGVATLDQVQEKLDKLESMIKEKEIQETRSQQDSAIDEFYKTRNDIYSDASKRQQLESYVINMFKGRFESMSKLEMSAALDMTATYLFPKVSISKKIDSAQEKTDLLNIYGGNSVGQVPKIDKTAVEALKNLGWDDKAIASFS